MDLYDKLKILTDAAKYDVSCTSSGADKRAGAGGIGSAAPCGICHSFSADGRCISLLKVLMTNICVFDCKYCVNRKSNDVLRAAFTPDELATLTIDFYRRNYIEGLFLSSGIIKNPDYTSELMVKTLEIIRTKYKFSGYIHAKAIPGADNTLTQRLGLLADRVSVNIELPSQASLKLLAPEKSKQSVLAPMGFIKNTIDENKTDLIQYRHAPKFAPAGQSTQVVVGATGESDYKILSLTEGLYKKYSLKRVFFSAYIPVGSVPALPAAGTAPPLLREHRLYQADWLLRFYGFGAKELLDPKCNWAVNNMQYFPVDINKADYSILLRVPGIGVIGAKRIIAARRLCALNFEGLKKIGISLKKAQHFITCPGMGAMRIKPAKEQVLRALMSDKEFSMFQSRQYQQLSFFDQQPMEKEGSECSLAKM